MTFGNLYPRSDLNCRSNLRPFDDIKPLTPDPVPAFMGRFRGDARAPGMAGLQSVGDTGALRLAADLPSHTRPGRRIWLGLPSSPNHLPIFAAF